MNEALKAARAQLHTAAQVPGAVGRTFAEPQADHGHTTLRWDVGARALCCQPLARTDARLGLRPHDLTLVWVDRAGNTLAELPLRGRMLADAYGFAIEELSTRGLAESLDMDAGYELEPTAQDRGEPFGGVDAAALEWFAAAYALAADALDAARDGMHGASTVRCWPHHFDIAVFHPLESGDPESSRSVGFGFSPGDGSYDDPYWYATPWPYPTAEGLPELASGMWHTDHWIGAVLPADGVTAEAARSFVRGAHDQLAELLNMI